MILYTERPGDAPAPVAGFVTTYNKLGVMYVIDEHGVVTQISNADPHALGGAIHSADTLANLNTKVSDATLDDSGDSRPPTGAASGDLGGTYPSPTVDDGADGTAIHDNVVGEINAIAVKGTPLGADIVLIEDSAASWAKKKATLSTLPARNLQAVCDEGNVSTTAMALGGAAVANGVSAINDFVTGAVGTDDHSHTILTSKWAEFAGTTTAGTRDVSLRMDCGTNRFYYYVGGAISYVFRGSDFYNNATGVCSAGLSTKRWKRLFSNHRAMGVLQIGDASASLDDEEFVRITEPAAGTNTATLPAAVIGYVYNIEVTSGAGTVNLATTGGDTINGGASPVALVPGLHMVLAQTTGDWCLVKVS